jgi:tetratricopeptide (TPR) repeat protein
MKTLIILILLFLSFSYSINAEGEEGTLSAPNKNVGIEVLKERINSNKEITTVQLNALDEKINNQQKMLTDKIASKSESLEKRMGIYLGFAMGLLAIIGFIGFKTIRNWIMQTIISKTDEEVGKYVTPEHIKNLLEEKGEEAVNTLLSELDTKAKEKLIRLDRLQSEYTASLAGLKKATADKGVSVTKETTEKLKQFEEKLVQAKTEDMFTSDDWFFKGCSGHEKEEYAKAISCFTKSIDLKPDPDAYSFRAYTHRKLKQYGKTIEDCNKAIELDTSHSFAYGVRGEAYILLKQYDEGFEDFKKAHEVDPECVFTLHGLIEAKFIIGDYKSTLDDIKKGLSLQPKIAGKAILFYLECIAKKLLNMETSESEATFNEILKKDFTTTWDFEMLESWVEDKDIDNDKKKFIKEKSALLKKHKRR